MFTYFISMYDIHPSPLVAVLKAVSSEIVYGRFENHHNYCKDVLCRYWRIGDNLERRRNFPLALSKGGLFLK